jgi:putative transcriptional regulator
MDAKQIREKTGLSQSVFAQRYSIPLATLRQWEQGLRVPTGPAHALLRLIKREPDTIAEILARSY